MRIAMWSGPRNLSTAMMYAFAERPDCAVWDEPFYAAFLEKTGIDHPMRDEILAAGTRDPQAVVRRCLGPVPGGKTHFYQKHMAHHMVDGMPLEWMADVTNVFLIRHPARVVASYVRKRENPTAEDLGFRQLADLFQRARDFGQSPPVLDSQWIRDDPARALSALCKALDIPVDPGMTRWAPGGRPEDGAWAPHWYGAIHRSSGFEGAEGPIPNLNGSMAQLAEDAMPHYLAMKAHALD